MTWWHGGPRIDGTEVLPPAVTGSARVCHGDPFVYVASERGLAVSYAVTCNGWLYEVEPVGELEQDPDSMLARGVSMRCPSATIIRRFKPSKAEAGRVSAVMNAVGFRA